MGNSVETPVHLWIIGALAVLWNGIGAIDFAMIQARDGDYLAQFTAAQRAYFAGFPAWAVAMWALDVGAGLAGALLLLARRRQAVTGFALSLAGLAGSLLYRYGLSTPPAHLVTATMIGTYVVVWIGATGLLVYAILMRRGGVLR